MTLYRLTAAFRDEAERNSRITTYLDATDEADAYANVDDILIPLAILSGGELVGVDLSRPIDQALIDTIKAAVALVGGARPLADHDVEKGGRFIFNTEDGKTTKMTIPAVRGTYITPSGDVDETSGPVGDFIDAIVDGDSADEDGNDITAFLKGYKVFKDRGQV